MKIKIIIIIIIVIVENSSTTISFILCLPEKESY